MNTIDFQNTVVEELEYALNTAYTLKRRGGKDSYKMFARKFGEILGYYHLLETAGCIDVCRTYNEKVKELSKYYYMIMV